MDSIKPALEALEALISDVERNIVAQNGPQNGETKQESSSSIQSTDGAPKAMADPAPQTENPIAAVDANSEAKAEKKKKKEKKPKKPAAPKVAPEVTQFLQCDLRVGKVTNVAHHPEADGLFVLEVSYSNEEKKTVCAGLRKFLSDEEMADRMVVTICNLKPRKLRGVASEAMILAGSVVSGEGAKETVVPIAPPESAQVGDIVGAQGLEGDRTVVEGKNVSGKTWDKVVPRLGVKDEVACYDGKPLVVAGGIVVCKLPDGAEIH